MSQIIIRGIRGWDANQVTLPPPVDIAFRQLWDGYQVVPSALYMNSRDIVGILFPYTGVIVPVAIDESLPEGEMRIEYTKRKVENGGVE